jgi:hypothetical protein
MLALGAFVTRTENIRQNCGEASRCEGNTSWELYPCGPPAHLAAPCALPTSTTVTTVVLSNVQDKPQSIRLATCLDRSAVASGAIAYMVSPGLPWRKLPVAGRAPGAGRVSGKVGRNACHRRSRRKPQNRRRADFVAAGNRVQGSAPTSRRLPRGRAGTMLRRRNRQVDRQSRPRWSCALEPPAAAAGPAQPQARHWYRSPMARPAAPTQSTQEWPAREREPRSYQCTGFGKLRWRSVEKAALGAMWPVSD